MNKRILILTKYELLKIFRQPITVFFALIFPILLIAFNGEVYGNAPSKLFDGVGTLDYVLPATVFLIILVHSLSNLPLIVSMNINSKVLKAYSVTKLTKIEYVTSVLLSNALWIMVSIITLFTFSIVKYNVNISPNLFIFVILTLIISCTMACFGIIVAVIFKNYQSVISVSFLLYFTILFTSGAAMPLPVLPETMQNAFQYSPFTHIVNLMQGVWLGKEVQMIDVFIVGLLALISTMTVIRTFKWE